MTVNREYAGETPCGMKFTTLAGVMGGGASSPGFVGHSKFNITQRKFIAGDGGLERMVWMPKMLKEEIKDRLIKRGEEDLLAQTYRLTGIGRGESGAYVFDNASVLRRTVAMEKFPAIVSVAA